MSKENTLRRFIAAFTVILAALNPAVFSQSSAARFPTKREESPDTWRRDGLARMEQARRIKFHKKRAKNVILFIGDGMGVSTVTAARILEGQQRGESGEENSLYFEGFPFLALSKTYSVNQQTADSAPTMVAIMTGKKTRGGMISVNQNARSNDHTSVEGNRMLTMLELAEMTGRATGIVTTARLTHATPAACYSHTVDRNWESDRDISRRSKAAFDAGFPDIARQLIEFPYGDGIEVALGGGRYNFRPAGSPDPEYPDRSSYAGMRVDGRDLTDEWQKSGEGSKYIWNREQFESLDVRSTRRLLGLFEPSHMQYENDRKSTGENEPSLTEMTVKAIEMLSRNKDGFFLMVEAGRIDHAHHAGNGFRALNEAVEFSNAVRAAAAAVDEDETLIIVTADHSHTLTIAGYGARGNNILGLTRPESEPGEDPEEPQTDLDNKPFTALGYANGPGGRRGERKGLTQDEVTAEDYVQEAAIPLSSETHGGEDVPIFATGTHAWMIHGVMEQNWIYYVMREAMRIDEEKLLKKYTKRQGGR